MTAGPGSPVLPLKSDSTGTTPIWVISLVTLWVRVSGIASLVLTFQLPTGSSVYWVCVLGTGTVLPASAPTL